MNFICHFYKNKPETCNSVIGLAVFFNNLSNGDCTFSPIVAAIGKCGMHKYYHRIVNTLRVIPEREGIRERPRSGFNQSRFSSPLNTDGIRELLNIIQKIHREDAFQILF